MRRLSHHFARLFLWIFTGFIPVFIAACYGTTEFAGMYDDRERSLRVLGRVLDSMTGSGIGGMKVSCVRPLSDAGVDWIDSTYTLPGDGEFELWYLEDSQCDEILVEDIDGEENGGLYATKSVQFDPTRDEVIVEMDIAE